jgi:hypothetical protein
VDGHFIHEVQIINKMKPTLGQPYRIHYINWDLPHEKGEDVIGKIPSQGPKSGTWIQEVRWTIGCLPL